MAKIRWYQWPVWPAWKLFAPKDPFGIGDKTVARLAGARSLAGFVAVVFANVAVGGNGLADEAAGQFTIGYGLAFLLLFLLPVPGLVLVFRGPAGRRRTIARYLLRVPLTVAAAFTFWYGTGWLVAGPGRDLHALVMARLERAGPVDGLLLVVVEILIIVALCWYVLVVLASVYYVVRGMFRASDAHPLLGPIGAIIVSVLGALGLVTVAGADQATPLLMTIAGVATTVVLSVVEWRRLNDLYGITTTSGPWPARRPAAPPLLPGSRTNPGRTNPGRTNP